MSVYTLWPSHKPFVKNLGVIFDNALILDKQINSVIKNSFFQLRLLTKVKPLLCFSDFEKVIHAFVSSRLDYCNSLYVGINQSLNHLQLVQNAATRLLTGIHKQYNICPILASLHWLPVHYRIDLKILLFVFKSLNGLASPYLSGFLCPQMPSKSLRSAGQMLQVVPRFRLKLGTYCAFAVAAPKLWNSLPHIRTVPTLLTFKSRLKTYLFSLAF
ncbi:hypothetical protein LDENG_00237930 [Lucifuga dentata]|nr:hypothetical protein LDENG_00237930 [Lucifuga dentata]